jgi:hypothetical protein
MEEEIRKIFKNYFFEENKRTRKQHFQAGRFNALSSRG